MSTTSSLGCEECRRGAYSGTWPPPKRLTVNPSGPTFLHRCEICGVFWDFMLRFATPITEEKARQLYPSVFET